MPSWKKVILSGSNAALNSLNVTNSLTASGIIYPTTDGTSGQVVITDGNGNLSFSNIENTTILIKNVSGTTIAKGTPCYITGSGTSGNVAGVWPADASNPLRMPAGVIADETLNNGDEGIGLINGFISGVNTSAFNAGDSIYVAVGGGYTNVRPTGSSVLIQKLGNVEKSHASNGSGVINGPGYYNEVPNIQQGYTWVGNSDGVATPIATSSIQNVVSSSYATTATQTSQAVTFNNGGSGAASGTTFNGSTARTISYNTIGAQPLLTNPVTGTGVDNRVAVWSGTTTQDSSANLTFDGSTLNIISGTARISTDGTYGSGYGSIGFGGLTNGYNRIFGNTGTSDGLFICSATGRGINFRANGGATTHMAITSAGNVGIGTTTANVRFVNLSAAYTAGPTLGSGTVGSQALLSNNGLYGMYSGVSSNGDVWHQVQRNDANTATYNILLNPAGGSVGIGTSTPGAYKLNVNGDTNVIGTLTATVKSFIIDHPTKEGKKLQYGVLEGPEHSVYVRGKLTNNNTITLPDHWTGLVHEDTITVNLTPIGKRQDLWVETVTDTSITVGSDNEINCFYTVFAERKDIEKLVTEFDK
ncbi:putative tail fiber-like protein [Flavobacterium phage vB_FspM_immuto_3-5A]|uniref:Putative tail fiber-like protein n=1 Tax=Flavobacterium phage vB_FspM_immuto_2-6A TaxID=2801477 RepID=A0A7T8ERR6_9CAUD|nr:putative tail fiber-like protein [Flavobacterium phage vB_FspM_immuto_2-6A]QQO91898.1 putative tail fiber-like protein [Flavobacterium phage vB_FspM_immuto_2-6A]QQO92136.1 putative tail fiber-like protein [Flavobacterium phage vB_FspM_immuto_3-5A]QQO92374.1 putative tail fiber-like protein [Flavobacterium phage vB_FspM_immuto_13-6C]